MLAQIVGRNVRLKFVLQTLLAPILRCNYRLLRLSAAIITSAHSNCGALIAVCRPGCLASFNFRLLSLVQGFLLQSRLLLPRHVQDLMLQLLLLASTSAVCRENVMPVACGTGDVIE